jgi:hypothetical protein
MIGWKKMMKIDWRAEGFQPYRNRPPGQIVVQALDLRSSFNSSTAPLGANTMNDKIDHQNSGQDDEFK